MDGVAAIMKYEFTRGGFYVRLQELLSLIDGFLLGCFFSIFLGKQIKCIENVIFY